MKRGKLFLLLIVALFMISGCGKERKLTCTLEDTISNIATKSEYIIEFKGNKVQDINFLMSIDYPEGSTDEEKEVFTNVFKQTAEESGWKFEKTDNGAILSADKNSESLTKQNIIDKKAKYDETKKTFEAQGYTCK